MGSKEAKRYRKLVRSTIDIGTRAKLEVMYEKAQRAVRRQSILVGILFAMVPANIYTLLLIIKELVK